MIAFSDFTNMESPHKVAMPVQYELRRLFHLMNIQKHRNSTQKALILGAYFNSWLRS